MALDIDELRKDVASRYPTSTGAILELCDRTEQAEVALAASLERVRVLEEALREIDDAIPPKPVLPLSCQIREIVRAALAKEGK